MQKKWPISDDIWLRRPVIQKMFYTKTAATLVTRVAAASSAAAEKKNGGEEAIGRILLV